MTGDNFDFDALNKLLRKTSQATMMKTILFIALIAILGFVLASEQRGRAPVRR
jgi:hypothetical protein